jgi:hypothetical protein
MPYSLATNVAHTEIWNRVWLARLMGLPSIKPYPDFPSVKPEDWPSVRGNFLEGLRQAQQIAGSQPFAHCCSDEAAARKLLIKIAAHTAYHVGHFVLLKRALRSKT